MVVENTVQLSPLQGLEVDVVVAQDGAQGVQQQSWNISLGHYLFIVESSIFTNPIVRTPRSSVRVVLIEYDIEEEQNDKN